MQTKRVIALGFFDGVHRGHAELLRRTKEVADANGAIATCLTFHRHPEDVVFGRHVPLISSIVDREEIMRRYCGIAEVIVINFDDEFMHVPWDGFLSDMLVEDLGAIHLVAGHDFRFGYRGIGDAEKLGEKCDELGVGWDIIPQIDYEGITVSSTYIRTLVENGDIERANTFLGHPLIYSGDADCEGRVYPPEYVLLPPEGQYRAEVEICGNSKLTEITIENGCLRLKIPEAQGKAVTIMLMSRL